MRKGLESCFAKTDTFKKSQHSSKIIMKNYYKIIVLETNQNWIGCLEGNSLK